MSSFVKRRGAVPIKGTRVSLHSAQPIISSGNPSLDHIFGGGFPIGSVIAIEEDKFANYSRVLTKYFLAEGLVNGHSTLIANLEEDPVELMKTLPTPVDDAEVKPINNNQTPEDMRIAFRYNNLSVVDLEQKPSTQQIGHFFDLSKQIEPSELDKHDIVYWNGSQTHPHSSNIFSNPIYQSLLDSIHRKCNQSLFDTSSTDVKDKNLLRICINSLGSPLWYDRNFFPDVILFLTILKSIIRNSISCCLITIPDHLFHHFENNDLYARLIDQIDYCVALESFAGSDKEMNPAFKEYHGLLNIVKLSALNALASFTPETNDLAFKLRRRKFVIEKLHLPPELGEDNREEKKQKQTLSCSVGGGNNKLDF
ncbi:elongator complex protein 4-like isoform X1 [Malaya genurostris]|uniref:elongator complex protein 4-like isoform X1 n=1 Tax=Malaya genurostris TaxID=325434 RepID=UPI0026F3A4E8|nr:elongator complex protein 4-like isoform X1 [Malaya genurostris]XP_058458268.1 elongator complex protein 4-like isoform X1 [Malaya genurostris]